MENLVDEKGVWILRVLLLTKILDHVTFKWHWPNIPEPVKYAGALFQGSSHFVQVL